MVDGVTFTELAVLVESPTFDAVVVQQRAGMRRACRDSLCAATRSQVDRVGLGRCAVCGVAITELAVLVESPTTHATVGKQGAGKRISCCHLNDMQPRGQRHRGWRAGKARYRNAELAFAVCAPTRQCVAIRHRTSVSVACGEDQRLFALACLAHKPDTTSLSTSPTIRRRGLCVDARATARRFSAWASTLPVLAGLAVLADVVARSAMRIQDQIDTSASAVVLPAWASTLASYTRLWPEASVVARSAMLVRGRRLHAALSTKALCSRASTDPLHARARQSAGFPTSPTIRRRSLYIHARSFAKLPSARALAGSVDAGAPLFASVVASPAMCATGVEIGAGFSTIALPARANPCAART